MPITSSVLPTQGPQGPAGPQGPPGGLPVPVALVSGAVVTIDVSLSDYFTLVAAHTFTLTDPQNPIHGRKLVVRIKQDAVGGRVMTLGPKWRLGVDIPVVLLSTAPNKVDYLGAIYDTTDDRWDVVAFSKGF